MLVTNTRSPKKVKCNVLYLDIHRQYLLLSEKFTSTEKKFENGPFDPHRNYTCSSKVFYENHLVVEKIQTIETDFGREYITCTCNISFLLMFP